MSEQSLIGSLVFVKRGDEELRAELLLERLRKGRLEFYVHYEGFNKRLDEWVDDSRLLLSRGVEWPPKKDEKAEKNGKKEQTPDQNMITLVEDSGPDPARRASLENFDPQREIEKLRTSGSMTQNHSEVSRVRNVSKVIFGEYEIEPWYFSPYPQELTEEDAVYICEYSLQYFGSCTQFERFRKKYRMRHPPGNEIYRDEKFSFFEIDGRLQRTWCRNLCLLSKLFLDHKTLYYDVDPFLFYCMTRRDEYGHHLVGYFSKEKESAEGYNVACILSLPPYQREGYGKVLIDFSYNLSKREGKVGSPEKPLSDLGLISYRSYWSDVICTYLIKNAGQDVTIDEISSATALTTADIMHTLHAMGMLKYHSGQHIVYVTNAATDRYERLSQRKPHRIDPAKLKWKPPVFTAAQLRFAW